MNYFRKDFSKRISSAFTGIWASILTEQIVNELSTTNYIQKSIDGNIVYIQQSEYAWYYRVFFIVILFITIWLIFDLLIPYIANRLNNLRYLNKPLYSQRQIRHNYDVAKQRIRSCVLNISTCSEEIVANPVFFMEDIEQSINILYKTFVSSKTTKFIFRNGNAIDDIGRYISPYEFTAILDATRNIIDKANENNANDLLKRDCEKLNERIDKLNAVIKQQQVSNE